VTGTDPKDDDKKELPQLDDKENEKPVPIERDRHGSFVWPEKRQENK
jgi:hypothetical protein